ncbi:hypothetical protein S2M10_01910 [Sphingomonas sp. S2M10]|uniref:hypothetical protein n=1 Tax=Sphingomonas sp. S2M10 TaxID=2705010 RepID=UPI00145660EA|nr:hypothetical protein [Sphingomonas sp. S2M10]NLS25228.1 hypothetical protein [Sphingomonas sp. S2M10]
MLIFVAGLAMTVPQCTELPRSLSGWEVSGAGLDTRHATTIPAKNGTAEIRVTIRKAGLFGIAADQPGWIDVARGNGRPLRMLSRAENIACANIRKIVYYRLDPGIYRVIVGKLQTPRVKLMLVHGDRTQGFARRGRLG